MTDPTEEGRLQRRVEALEHVARGLTPEQIAAFEPAVRDAPTLATWPARESFSMSKSSRVKLTKAEQAALATLWTRMLAGLAFAVNGEEVEQWVARPTLLGRLDRLVEPRHARRIEGRATTVIQKSLGSGVWVGVVGIWNAFCEALLGDRLAPALRADLRATWQQVISAPIAL